jgi:hypothetical protein
MIADPAELQIVKDALALNSANVGVGVLHEPSAVICVAPFDVVPGGHAGLAGQRGLPLAECKGFLIGIDALGACTVANMSHLNGAQGQPGSLQMPLIVQALHVAGL